MEKMKYEQAVHELETIVQRLENNELNLDEMSSKLKRAQQLIKFCKDRLTKSDEEIKKILENN
ncbi:MAG: exodeoxyribonuclease VII small subunit [Prevotella sp.]|jgi:exodeoxyribonuclease VII small subunit|nr:exodeoxyribonuclease VII small subunit [Prevotella sp.]